MRARLKLVARRDASYQATYHHKFRGAVWTVLEDTEYSRLHDAEEPSGFTFSNPYPLDGDVPWDGAEEGEVWAIDLASPREEMLTLVLERLVRREELNIGEMPFRAVEASVPDAEVDVGEPGTSGVLETQATLAALPPHYKQQHETDKRYWNPDLHPMEPFEDYIEWQLQRKFEVFGTAEEGPLNVEYALFDSYTMVKDFGMPLTVTEDQTLHLPMTRWELGYEVHDEAHREHLNLALEVGLGARCSSGLGYTSIKQKREGLVAV